MQISELNGFLPRCPPRLRPIVTCIGPNQKNQLNLDLYLVQRYTIGYFPIVVLYLCIGQNQKNQPNLVLDLVRRSKIFVSVATFLPPTLYCTTDRRRRLNQQRLSRSTSASVRNCPALPHPSIVHLSTDGRTTPQEQPVTRRMRQDTLEPHSVRDFWSRFLAAGVFMKKRHENLFSGLKMRNNVVQNFKKGTALGRKSEGGDERAKVLPPGGRPRPAQCCRCRSERGVHKCS